MSKIVHRTLDFLELYAAQRRPLTLSDIARLLGIPVSSCHDVLRTLQSRGYLYEVGQRHGFYPTVRLRAIGDEIARHDPLVHRAESVLGALRAQIDESVFLAKASGLRLTYLLVLEASHPLRYLVGVGDDVRSLHASSAGRALLGSLDEDQLAAFLAGAALDPLTPQTITSPQLLRADIAAGNRRGWFLNAEQSVPGATTVSARFSWAGSVYTVTVAGPTARIRPRLDEIATVVTGACAALEAGLAG